LEFQEINDACLMCSMAYKTPRAIKELYGMHAHVVEDAERSMRYYLLVNERTKSQIIVLCGVLQETSVPTKPIDIYVTFGFDKAAEQIDTALVKYLKKDYTTMIYGHSLGAALAVLFALHLQSEGFKLEKLITFGQPKIIKEKESAQYKSLPLLRIVDSYDPVPLLFSNFVHIGPEIVLLEDHYYCNLKEHAEDLAMPTKFDNNHIESYVRNLKNKLKTPIPVQYQERSEIAKKLQQSVKQ